MDVCCRCDGRLEDDCGSAEVMCDYCRKDFDPSQLCRYCYYEPYPLRLCAVCIDAIKEL